MKPPARFNPARVLACAAALACPPLAHTGTGAHAAIATEHARAHPYHVTYAEATLDRERGVLQVAMRLWPDDLQLAIERFTGNTDLDIDSPEADEHIVAYLGTRFLVRTPADDTEAAPLAPGGVDRDAPPVRWVGKEIGIKHAWVYFETPVPDAATTIDIANAALFGVVPRQETTIELRVGDRRLSAVSTPRDPWTRLRLDRGADTVAMLAGTLGDRLRSLDEPIPLDTDSDGPLRLITLRLPDPDTHAPPATELLASVARAAPLLAIAEPGIAERLRTELARRLGDRASLDIIDTADGPAEPLRRATAHIASPGSIVAILVRSPGGSTPANRVANALRSLEPDRNVRAAIAFTTEPIAGRDGPLLADLRGLPAPSMARWAEAADQRGPVFPAWLVIRVRSDPGND